MTWQPHQRSTNEPPPPPLPLASCLLPTYNKFASSRYEDCTVLVEEAVESFLRQTYPNKELLLVNDCPVQTYECSAPGVTVINLPRRFRSLGEKLNFMIGISKGDLLFRWDDDDIQLPWRLQTQVDLLADWSYINVRGFWFDMQGQCKFETGTAYCQTAFRRELYVTLRGYTFMGVGEDMDFQSRAEKVDPDGFFRGSFTEHEAVGIYRWGTGSEHVSGYGDPGYEKMGETQIKPGHKVLQPRWRVNYVDKVKGVSSATTTAPP